MVKGIQILPQDYQRLLGRDALRTNILAARLVAEIVRTTLGPRGMDKMLVDELGDIVITNDGVTILEEMSVEHPAAKLMVEVAKTQEQEAGDGTTTAVVIAGELLRNAEDLLDQNIHPTIIVKGYNIALREAEKILEEIAENIDIKDKELLKKVALTTITGKFVEASREKIAELVVEAVLKVLREEKGELRISKDDIKIVKKHGGAIEDSELIEGVVLDKEKVHPDMPDRIDNAKVLLLSEALEVKEPEIDAKIQITSPDQIEAFLSKEEEILRRKVEKIKEIGANVVFVQKGIDDIAQYYLAKYGIFAVRRVKKSDMEKLAKATGAKIVSNLEDVDSSVLGEAEIVEQKKIGGENFVIVKGKKAKAVTLLLRGGTEHVTEELERAVEDAIGSVISLLKDKKAVAGGGAVETELSIRLDKVADKYFGKEQLAIKAFAKALEIIPKTLAENSGLDAVDILAKLKAEHEKGNKWAGVDVYTGEIKNMWDEGVIEPLRVKMQALKSATEAATLILRIDDIIAAQKKESSKEESQTPEFNEEE